MINIAIITIFREDIYNTRHIQKNIFLEKIQILKKYGNFDIFLIEQSNDNQKFNIGKLKNIGFELANNNNNYDFFILTDIDILPDENLAPYYFKPIKGITLFGTRGSRYKGECLSGSAIGIDKESFLKINGYPNSFWGWGGEDDNFLMRCNYHKIKIFIPKKGNIIDIEYDNLGKNISSDKKLMMLKDGNLKEDNRYEKLLLSVSIWNTDGLNNLNYKILDQDINKIRYYKVDLQYDIDQKLFPNWFKLYKFQKISEEKIKYLYYKLKKKYKKCIYISY